MKRADLKEGPKVPSILGSEAFACDGLSSLEGGQGRGGRCGDSGQALRSHRDVPLW